MSIRTLAFTFIAGTLVAGALATSAMAAPGGGDQQQQITVRKAGGVQPESIIAVL